MPHFSHVTILHPCCSTSRPYSSFLPYHMTSSWCHVLSTPPPFRLSPHPVCRQLSAYPVSFDGTTNTAISLTKFKAAYTLPTIVRLSSGIQSDASSCFLSSPLPLFSVPGASFSTNFTIAIYKYVEVTSSYDTHAFYVSGLHVVPAFLPHVPTHLRINNDIQLMIMALFMQFLLSPPVIYPVMYIQLFISH